MRSSNLMSHQTGKLETLEERAHSSDTQKRATRETGNKQLATD
ncbi:MAG: hypothetical protein PHF18_04385 [Methanosarcina sp.]|nr:hypothetical protein [Methanosarcina sp.]MDD3246085.1 hypothetical protein [Methanosarcina sp.]MDD4249883.1 hypothetical protein [Methanosarcina sp.]